jgi:signal transduction histidine kinase
LPLRNESQSAARDVVLSQVSSIIKYLIVVGTTLLISFATAMAAPKRIIVLQSNGQDFKPWSDYARAFQQELERQSSWPVVVQHFPVALGLDEDGAGHQLAAYLRELYSRSAPDLIVAFGAPAAAFLQRRRAELFPDVPALLAAIDERRVSQTSLTGNDAVAAVWVDVPALFANILRLLPRTKNIAVVIGSSPNEAFWLDELRSQLQPLGTRVNLLFWNDLPFDQILRRAGALPKDSAIFWVQPQVDVTGAAHDGEQALKRLHAVANAPIFSHDDAFFGGEIVGGPMTSVSQGSQAAVAVALRILAGEQAGEIRTPVLKYGPARYDWRELKRWDIPESRLPEGSQILFRQLSPWELYRWQVVAVCSALLLQALLIGGLLYERRRRLLAEVDSRQRMSELAHVNRFATAGELTTSISHELNQPLGAILSNAESLELILKAPTPDLDEARQIASEIRRDDERASEVIRRLRSLLKKAPFDSRTADLNEITSETVEFLSALALGRGVEFRTVRALEPLTIKGDRIQLQQVIVNLIINAIDAMSELPSAERQITIRTERSRESAEVSIADKGRGIPPDKLKEIFQPFFSTKPRGMGMGLSIARTIVEAHGGRLSAENLARGGAVLRVELPIVRSD